MDKGVLEMLEAQAWQVLRGAYLRALCAETGETPLELDLDRQDARLQPFYTAMEHEVGLLRELFVQAAASGQEVLLQRMGETADDPRVMREFLGLREKGG